MNFNLQSEKEDKIRQKFNEIINDLEGPKVIIKWDKLKFQI